MESENQFGARRTEKLIDARQYTRFKLDTDVKIYSRANSRVLPRAYASLVKTYAANVSHQPMG